MTNLTSNRVSEPSLDQAGKKRIVVVLAYFAIEAGILFLAAGQMAWLEAWIYLALRLSAFLTLGIWAARKNPELINERGRRSDKTKPWDKVFGAIYAPLMLITPAVAGLDAVRYGWSNFPAPWKVVGFVLCIPAMILPYWAMSVNQFMVTTVRLQEERGHRVVRNGPYQYVRHPMYVGAILLLLSGPLLLGSWWALVPGGLATVALLVRTKLEDQTLRLELPGYADYAQRTRYRLLPGIW